MSFRRCSVRDRFGLTERKITDEGFLVAPARIARTGIQEYRARELGLDKNPDGSPSGVPPEKVIRLHRPMEEVHAPKAVASFNQKTLTEDHPPEKVSTLTWNDVAVGDLYDVRSDGEFMVGTICVKDPDAIKAVQSGKDQMSCGYDFQLDMTSGKTADGQDYDGVMRDIVGNHLAIVDFARGGSRLRVADSKRTGEGERTMATRTIVVDGVTIELESLQASLVEKVVKDVNDKVGASNTARDTAVAALKPLQDEVKQLKEAATAAKAATDAKVAELEAKILKPEELEARVEERTKLIGDARAILGDDFVPKGKSNQAIRVAALDAAVAADEQIKTVASAVLGGVEIAKAPETDVRKAFDAVVAARATRPAQDNDDPIGRSIIDGLNGGSAGENGGGGNDAKAPKLIGRDKWMADAAAGKFMKQASGQAA